MGNKILIWSLEKQAPVFLSLLNAQLKDSGNSGDNSELLM